MGESGAGLVNRRIRLRGAFQELHPGNRRLRSNVPESSSTSDHDVIDKMGMVSNDRKRGGCIHKPLMAFIHFTLLGTRKVSLFQEDPSIISYCCRTHSLLVGDTFTWRSSHRQ